MRFPFLLEEQTVPFGGKWWGRNLRRVINQLPIVVFLRFVLHVMHNTLNLGTKTKCIFILLCGNSFHRINYCLPENDYGDSELYRRFYH